MSVELYLGKRLWDGRVYRRVADYDAVLRSHCGLEPVVEEVEKQAARGECDEDAGVTE